MADTFWALEGNAGTDPATDFVGTTDNTALEFRVNDSRAFRLEPNATSPNVIGGSSENSVAAGVLGATIGGGGAISRPSDGARVSVVIPPGQPPPGSLVVAQTNRVTDDYGTIGGGRNNQAGDNDGTISDRPYATVGGGEGNTASGAGATVGGGQFNTASSGGATVGGGHRNTATRGDATVGGGERNTASGIWATVGGGDGNTASGTGATVGGGGEAGNTASGATATVGGGSNNTASGDRATVGGGSTNTASEYGATVPGGHMNTAAGETSFAAGRGARANHHGAFVWGDSEHADVASSATNQFTARTSGGARFFSNSILTTGVALAAGGGSWSSISDRAVKADLRPVEPGEILARVASLPITTWRYVSQDDSIHHIGPSAQDFHAAFGVGEDDRHITAVDADGVALAAIQGLNEKVEEKDARLAELESRLATVEGGRPSSGGLPAGAWWGLSVALGLLGLGVGRRWGRRGLRTA
jgi:hypothetical protein